MDFKKDWFDVAKKVIMQTGQFFANMPAQGGYSKPLKFAVTNYFVFGIITSLIIFLINNTISPFISLVFIVVGGTISLFLLATIFYINLKLLGSDKNYEVTFRVIAYLSALIFLLLVPVVGAFAPFVIIYFAGVAFKKTHNLTTTKAIIAVVASTVLFSVCYFIFLFILMMIIIISSSSLISPYVGP